MKTFQHLLNHLLAIILLKAFSINLQIVEEAGGTVSLMDGGKFCVFDRSVLVSNGVLHAKVGL
jgi:hypothetical protein